jgi:3-hydroxyisobutyrate dehydrogenase-like beta-hydroxyacid dehydrogenase
MEERMKERIAFIGLGAMGNPKAMNWIDPGYKMAIYNLKIVIQIYSVSKLTS